jgi:flagellar biosynthesis/type III secretory pathway M-ring protein FliF/YscJ
MSLGLGFIFARSWEDVAAVFGSLSSLVLALLVALFILTRLMRRIRQRRLARRASAVQAEEIEMPQSQDDIAKHNTGPMLIPD